MTEPIEIRDYQPNWIVARTVCTTCGKGWIAVLPFETRDTLSECPRCGLFTGIHTYLYPAEGPTTP